VAIGDLMLARDLVTLMDRYGAIYPFEHVAPVLSDADITVANLEGTFTDRGTPADKKYVFRTPPRDAAGLALAGIDVVSLANNHALDYGLEGLRDTIATLDAEGIAHCGAGENDVEARRPAILEVRGLRVAFLSYAATPDAVAAAPGVDGVAWGDVDTISEDVRRAAEQADVVVVLLHAGNEYADEPSDTQRLLAQAAVEAGATLVLGHHPHVLQRWESRGRSFVAYSLGNFVFDLDEDDLAQLGPAPFQTVALKITVSAGGVEKVEPIPVYIDPQEDRPRPARPAEADAIVGRIQRLAGDVGTP
jgi:poly-gamma-glutamate synthesis protein (capsule biosynthesis protein)